MCIAKIRDFETQRYLFLWLYGHIIEASEPYEIAANLITIIDGERFNINNFKEVVSMATCKTCHGKGSVKCPKCKGTGRIVGGPFTSSRKCDNCNGSGVVKCGACNGKGYV